MRDKGPSHLVLFSVFHEELSSLENLQRNGKFAEALSNLELPYTVTESRTEERSVNGYCVYLRQNPGTIIFQEEQEALYQLARDYGVKEVVVVSPERSVYSEGIDHASNNGAVASLGLAEFTDTLHEGVTRYVRFPGGTILTVNK